jgi:hypothetical protein
MGSTAVQPCPDGQGSWHCNSRGQWSKLDLSGCRSKNWSILNDALEVENALGSMINLRGGDIVPLLDRVASLTDHFDDVVGASEINARYGLESVFFLS